MTPLFADLPLSPSVNEAYKNIKSGRAKTKRYRTWANAAGWELNAQRVRPVRGPVEIELRINPPKNADPDNRIKAVLDLLVDHRLIDGDTCQTVRRVSVIVDETVDPRRCSISVWSVARGAVPIMEAAQ